MYKESGFGLHLKNMILNHFKYVIYNECYQAYCLLNEFLTETKVVKNNSQYA